MRLTPEKPHRNHPSRSGEKFGFMGAMTINTYIHLNLAETAGAVAGLPGI